MSIFNFIDPEQLDELNEDPRIAFMELANIVTRKLHEQTLRLDEDQEGDWRQIEELRYSCMNILLASAKRLGIEPFASMEVPPYDSNRSSNWQAFRFDLDHYVTQIVLDNSTRNRSNSVAISPKTKEQIRVYIHNLRECIEKGSLDDKKREALLGKLDALEKELEKRRLSMIAVATIAYHIFAVPGTMWASADIANKLMTNVMTSVAEAKAEEDATKKIVAPEPVQALSPPRKPKETLFKTIDLDDDIPF